MINKNLSSWYVSYGRQFLTDLKFLECAENFNELDRWQQSWKLLKILKIQHEIYENEFSQNWNLCSDTNCESSSAK